MSKNYASIYNSGNDSIALEQRWYAKVETVRGTMVEPANTDFFYALQGGSVTYTQPKTSSPQRSGRHNNSVILEKKSTEWSLPMLVNIDTSVAAGATEVDAAVQVLWESMLGKKTISSGVIFECTEAPDTTFTLFNCGDLWAEQIAGAFCQTCEVSLPGDGQAQMTFGGAAKTRILVGIAKSIVDNDAGNTLTLGAGEARKIPVGAKIMIIEADGTTRSADTATSRNVTISDTSTDIITVDGAVLADADGSGLNAPIYICYFEPLAPVGINDPQTGLVGSISIDNFPSLACLRSATLSLNNNHELQNFCYGSDSLSGVLFVPGARLEAMLTIEANLNANMLEFISKVQEFSGNDITLILGDATSRHLKIEMPKVIFNVPAISVPENGSIPISFDEGMCLQSALDAGDEVKISYI